MWPLLGVDRRHKQLEKTFFFIKKKLKTVTKRENLVAKLNTFFFKDSFHVFPAVTGRWVSCVDSTAPARRRSPRCHCLCLGALAFWRFLLHLLLLWCSQTLAPRLRVPAPSAFLPEGPPIRPVASRLSRRVGAGAEPGSAFAGQLKKKKKVFTLMAAKNGIYPSLRCADDTFSVPVCASVRSG